MELAALALTALLAATDPSGPPAAGPPLPSGPVKLDGHPIRLAALPSPEGGIEVFLLRERDLDRFRLEGRTLVRTGRFRSPFKVSRPLWVDAGPGPEGAPLVTVVFAEDVQSVDEGTDTRLHSWILSPEADGSLRPVSGDIEAYARLLGGALYAQRRGANRLVGGPVLAVERAGEGYAVGTRVVPWASPWLLASTPLPGGSLALAFEEGHPMLFSRDGGDPAAAGALLGDFGKISHPGVSVRLARPVYVLGLDKEGRRTDDWHPIPRRIALGSDGAAYTVDRGRARGLPVIGKTTGRDSVVRLEAARGELAASRPFPGVEAFLLDFALVERSGSPPLAVLLLDAEDEDGSGEAFLLVQRAR